MNVTKKKIILDPQERKRLLKMSTIEKKLRKEGYRLIAGVDEAGRGPLAGPVVAAACILPEKFLVPGINDSKLVLPAKREELYYQITHNPQVIYSISAVPPKMIDQINIFQASLLAMKQALEALEQKAEYILVDGKHLPDVDLPGEKIIKGDTKSLSIAAASILAKYARDQIMEEAHICYPMYGFNTHKGYATEKHLRNLKEHGPSPIHRYSFMPVKHHDKLFSGDSVEKRLDLLEN